MGIRFFRGQKTRFEHEHYQLKEIIAILRKAYPKEPVYFLTNVLVANGQIDCVILTKKGPLILDLKAFKGEISGIENGKWEVDTKDGPITLPNLFIQAKIHRQDFIDRMIPVCREHFPHIGENNLRKIGSWLYFCKGGTYEEGQIDFRRVKWFRIVTAESLLEKMRFADSGYTLRIQDMDEIVKGFGLQEYSFKSDSPVVPITRAPRRKVTISRWTLAVAVFTILALAIIALLVFVPGARIAIVNTAQGFLALLGGLIHSASKDVLKSNTSEYDSQQALIYLNQIRVIDGKTPLAFDDRAYHLAMARAEDMSQYGYLNYSNPITGASAESLKDRFGISENESILENAYGQWNGYSYAIEKQAIDSWFSDEGNHQRLLLNFSSGAVACSGGYCSFIGVHSLDMAHSAVPIINITQPVP
ncbi:MAG TPA: NERD domain-containing protein [Methanoregulaceae archaeon]|nr:NERD domain-containing protein [Methanoregulaceae archaeon]